MSDDKAKGRPQFKLVQFLESNGIPIQLARPLLTIGVPEEAFGLYHVAEHLTVLESPRYHQIISFGVQGFYNVCFVPETSAVVVEYRYPNGGIASQIVNTTLEQFNASVLAVYNRFPFDSWDQGNPLDAFDDFDQLNKEWAIAATDLRKVLQEIDPVSNDPQGFWVSFTEDIMIGDYFTRDILKDYI